jgi:hypothetical protein
MDFSRLSGVRRERFVDRYSAGEMGSALRLIIRSELGSGYRALTIS